MPAPLDPASAVLRILAFPAVPDGWEAALAGSPFGPFEVRSSATVDELQSHLSGSGCDALLLQDGVEASAVAAELDQDVALLVVLPGNATPAAAIDWMNRGVQDLLSSDEAPLAGRRLRAAIVRARRARDARLAYATDLDTGLPHQQQLIEHMSQLLALREREPAPMAVLALRVEGLASAEARHGRSAAHALRRKIGVRLRAGVRASDVVASLGEDSYGVLLGSVLTPADAERVGAKLLRALAEPFRIGTESLAIATALGIGQYPADGTQPEALLRRAVGLAAAAQSQGRAGFANFGEAGPGDAANDA